MNQAGAVFVVGEIYIRMKDSGHMFPVHKEQNKIIKRGEGDYVKCTAKDKEGNYTFELVSNLKEEKEEPAKIVSTPARMPEITPATAVTPSVIKVNPDATDVTENPGPPVVKTFAVPGVKVASTTPDLPPVVDLSV